jgi:hypothetical protein
MAAFELITNTEVGSGGAATIAFSSLGSYDHLYLCGSLRTDTSDAAGWDDIYMDWNGSGANFGGVYYELSSSSPVSGTFGNSKFCRSTSSDADAGFFNPFECWIPNYRGTVGDKVFMVNYMTLGYASSTTYWRLFKVAATWRPSTPVAVTSLSIGTSSGVDEFVEHSNVSIYGVNGAT